MSFESMLHSLAKRTLLSLVALLLPLTAIAAVTSPSAHGNPCPSIKSERLIFNVGWEFINAGTADMRIQSRGDAWEINTLAKTNRFFDLFKKVRDTISARGRCEPHGMQSISFDIEQHERKYHAKKQTRFLWKQNKVAFTQNGKTDLYEVPAGHLHVLDAFLLVRAQKLTPGQTLNIPVFDSRKRYEVEVRVGRKKKKMRLPWGGFADCILVEPRLKTEGIFSSVGKIKIWMTDDARHVPLKMVAEIKIGHIVATLDAYEGGNS